MSNDTQAITKTPTPPQQPLTLEAQAFGLLQRRATLLANSTLVPKDFQGNVSNCAIGVEIADRLRASAFMVLQNIDIIHGRPSFRATFLIAMVNASGRFSPLQFRMDGDKANRSCVAHCKDLLTGEVVEGPEVSLAMAKAEGWSTKSGSKWVTMPELMLRYRAAAFFARLYAPDITLGMQTSDEVQDISEPRDVTPQASESRLFQSVKKEPETLALDTSAPSRRETFLAKVQALGAPWPTVCEILASHELIAQRYDRPELVEDHEVTAILGTWSNLEKLVKGGAK